MAAHAAVTTGQLDQPTSPTPGEVPDSTTAGGGANIDPSASQEAPSEFQLAVTAAAKKECAAFALANAAIQKTKESEEIAALKLDLAAQKILRLEAENSELKAKAAACADFCRQWEGLDQRHYFCSPGARKALGRTRLRASCS